MLPVLGREVANQQRAAVLNQALDGFVVFNAQGSSSRLYT
jgi:hypothetical protein